MEDWRLHLPPEGLREMCSWERFCTFAREPKSRKVAVDAHVSVAGVRYEVDPELEGETVIVWFGLYDDQLYVEHGERRYGPYAPSGGPIPLHHYRRFKKTRAQQRAENSHQPTRQRERRMQGFKSPGHAQRFLSAHGPIASHFRPRRHRLSARAYLQAMTRRFHAWQEITGTAMAA